MVSCKPQIYLQSIWAPRDLTLILGRGEQLLNDLGPLPLQMLKIKQKRIRRNDQSKTPSGYRDTHTQNKNN